MAYEVNSLGPLGWKVEPVGQEPPRHPDGVPAPLFAPGVGALAHPAPDQKTAENLAILERGGASTVVTGQQPGRLIGPLYTLFKIATAVDLAAHRTVQGHPTVPVFWSGDADDDLDEAMAPLCWDPATRAMLQLPSGPGRKHPGRLDPMIGRVSAAETVGQEATWLAQRASESGPGLVADLADLWAEAVDEGLTWGPLQHRAVARVFSGTGLVIVSGDDPALHQAAAPLYSRILDQWPAVLAAGRKRQGHLAISERSWRHPMFRVSGEGRVPLESGEKPASLQDLRPGVVFRSPVQDWLLRPVAVVAGPGEWAYLKQLEGVYEHLGIPRSPLVPRLSAWVLPEAGVEPDLLEGGVADEAAEQSGRVAAAGRQELERILIEEIGSEEKRARELAAGRTRRWIKGLESMLRDEAGRARRQRVEAYPGWVFPRGQRQERSLAAGCALALWGEDLLAAITRAATRHREAGAAGQWQTFGLTVPDPNSAKGKS